MFLGVTSGSISVFWAAWFDSGYMNTRRKRLLDVISVCLFDSGSHCCVCFAREVQEKWIGLGDGHVNNLCSQRSWLSGYMLACQPTELFLYFAHFHAKTDALMLERSWTMASLPLVTAQFLCALTGGTCSSSSCSVCPPHGGTFGFKGVVSASEQVLILAWSQPPVPIPCSQTSLFPLVHDRFACRATRSLTLVSALEVARTSGMHMFRGAIAACRDTSVSSM